MRIYEPGDPMPERGERLLVKGVPCVVTAVDCENGRVEVMPLMFFEIHASDAFKHVVSKVNNESSSWWVRSPRCHSPNLVSVYDGDGSLRSIGDILSELAAKLPKETENDERDS